MVYAITEKYLATLSQTIIKNVLQTLIYFLYSADFII